MHPHPRFFEVSPARIILALGLFSVIAYSALQVPSWCRASLRARDEARAELAVRQKLGEHLAASSFEVLHRKMEPARQGSQGKPEPEPAEGARGPRVAESAALGGSKTLRQRLHSAQLSLEVKTFGAAFDRVQEIAVEAGGFVSGIQSTRQGEGGRATGTLTIRVPADRYEGVLNRIRPLGRLQSETSTVQDVTRQCLNLDARIALKRELQARNWSLVRHQPQDRDSLRGAEQTLDRVSGELEGLEAERDRLQQDLVLSAINLELHEAPLAPVVKAAPAPWAPLRVALQEAGIKVILDGSRVLYACLVLLPWGLMGWGLWRVSRRYLPRWRQRLEGRL